MTPREGSIYNCSGLGFAVWRSSETAGLDRASAILRGPWVLAGSLPSDSCTGESCDQFHYVIAGLIICTPAKRIDGQPERPGAIVISRRAELAVRPGARSRGASCG